MTELQGFIASRTPPGWETRPLWSLFRRRKLTGYADEELLSVYRDYGVIPKSSRDDNHNKESDDLSGYQLVTEGSLVTNKMKAWQGSIAISRYRGIVSPAYYVYEPLSAECDQFLHYLLRSEPYIALYGRISKGVRVNQWDLEHEALRNVPVMLPRLDTQKAIADFLDRETARIDQLIEKKQRFVGLLKEKYKAEKKRLVFDLDNQSVERNDSAVSWFPDLPSHWRFMRSAHIFNNLDSRRIPLSAEQRGDLAKVYPYYGASGIIDAVDDYLFDGDTILVGEDGANLVMQSTPIAFKATGKYWVNNHAHILTPRFGDFDYWIHALNEVPYEVFVTGSAQPKLTSAVLGNIRLPVPPAEEQAEIAGRIDTMGARVNAAIEPVRDSIERLKEFRSALITAAVTGQIDVTTWGKQGQTDRRLDEIEEAMQA